MQVRLRVAWQDWPRGHVFTDMPAGQARTLIALNKAEEVTALAEAKGIVAPLNRMMRAGRDIRTKSRMP